MLVVMRMFLEPMREGLMRTFWTVPGVVGVAVYTYINTNIAFGITFDLNELDFVYSFCKTCPADTRRHTGTDLT